MKIFILIGFEYQNVDGTDNLPGTIVDLYRMYKLAMAAQFDQIMVITDIQRDRVVSKYHPLIMDEVIDSGVLDFIETTKVRGHYYYCTSSLELTRLLQNRLILMTKIAIYYTGHGLKDSLVLPTSGDRLPISRFRRLIVDQVGSIEIIIIFDCCQSSSFNLPFRYHYQPINDRLRYTVSGPQPSFCKQKITVIASTLSDEQALANKRGSYFTFALSTVLANGTLGLFDLCKDLYNFSATHNQLLTIYTSFPNIKHLWSWMVNPSFNSAYTGKYHIIITRNNLQVCPL